MAECKEFREIYADGRAIAEKMWGDAFTYETNESLGYNLWFFNNGDFENNNPNNKIARNLDLDPNVSECQIFNGADRHKSEGPSAEEATQAECLPWRGRSCCSHTKTASSVNALNNLYGNNYKWDRCGTLSPACERFFVFEACFYECEPLTGMYRRYKKDTHVTAGLHQEVHNSSNENHNEWEVYKMPVKASYWDEWHRACHHDKFCAADDGNFFSCAKIAPAVTSVVVGSNTSSEVSTSEDSNNTGLIAGLAVVSSLLLLTLVGIALFCLCCYKKKTVTNAYETNTPHS